MSVLAAQQDERLVLENPRLYFGSDSLQLKLQLLLGDPQATAVGCWRREEYAGCHGSPDLPDQAGVLLGLAHPPPGSEPRHSLAGFLHCWGLGFQLALSYSFCFILKKFSGFSTTYLSQCAIRTCWCQLFPPYPSWMQQ